MPTCAAVRWHGSATRPSSISTRIVAGPAREVIIRLAHGVAKYLMDRQVASPGDPRDGLVLGGEGAYALELIDGEARERYTPGAVAWASTEHNIDAYFFLRDFAKLTGEARFAQAAQRIAAALSARGFSAEAGQLVQGLAQTGPDKGHALDCASWGALFLLAAGDSLRAETALGSAEWRYASREPASGALGHKPYAHAAIIANPALATQFATAGGTRWDQVEGVWPEGSAGVALASLRLGRRARAQATEILTRSSRSCARPRAGCRRSRLRCRWTSIACRAWQAPSGSSWCATNSSAMRKRSGAADASTLDLHPE